MAKNPSLILINPWIYDFAAYDLWSKPLGLLYLAGYLRKLGFHIHLMDCLEVHHPRMKSDPTITRPVRRDFGTGKFWRKAVPLPPQLRDIKRSYSRYGITKQLFVEEISKVRDPSAVLVTSLMTYWYPGVSEVISLVKETFPHVPILLGGIYARLCRDHAVRHSGADLVVDEMDLNCMDAVPTIIAQWKIPIPYKTSAVSVPPYPAFDLQHKIEYVCLLTSTGCPYRCRYCASHILHPSVHRRDPEEVFEEIRFWKHTHAVQDFAFYDDALLVNAEHHAVPILEKVVKKDLDVRFHTPNALHIREINPDLADLLYRAGFHSIRLGLETSDMALHDRWDGKVSKGEFERAVKALKRTGFTKKNIGVYILVGLPGQSVESVMETITLVGHTGTTPYLAEYSPLPHTPLWEKAQSHSRYNLAGDPLFHNNTLLPCWDEDKRKRMPELKALVRDIRQTR